jgi:hypothetical protein
LNLIGNVDVRVASTPDTAFFQDDINKVEPVFTEPVEDVHADGLIIVLTTRIFVK